MTEIAIIEPEGRPALRIPTGRGAPKRDEVLDPGTAELIMEGIPPNTINTYRWCWNRLWLPYTDEMHRCPYPATSTTLANFVNWMARTPKRRGGGMYAPNTIETAMAAVAVYHRMAAERWGDEEVSPPSPHRAYQALEGYIKRWLRAGNRIRKADALPLAAVKDLILGIDTSTLRGKRNKWAMLAAIGMGARRSELPSLDIPDVAIGEHGLKIYLPFSKTDQTGDGAITYLPYGKHEQTCVVGAWIDYRAELFRRGITSGPVLRPVDRFDRMWGQAGDEPFAGKRSDGRLTPGGFEDLFHCCVKPLKLPLRLTPHTTRATMFTLAAKGGAPPSALNRQGRLTDTSTVGLQYVRDAELETANAMTMVDL